MSLRKRWLFFSLCIFIPVIFSSAQTHYWARKAGGSTLDGGLDISIDASGNTYTTGFFSSSASFGSISLSCAGVTDIFLTKVDSLGIFQWAVKEGGTGSDKGNAVKTDAAGNTFVTGFFSSSFMFGSTSVASAGLQDIFVAKYNSAGALQWVTTAGGTLADMGNAITVDNAGNVIVTGEFTGTCNWGTTALTSQVNPSTGLPSTDVFIAKYDPSGTLLWVKQGSSPYTDRGTDVVTDNLNNIYVTGQFSDTIVFDVTHLNSYFNAAFLIKYNSGGTEQWFREIASSLQIYTHGISISNNTDIIVTGDFKGTLFFMGPPVTSMTSAYPNAILLAKYTTSGNLTWSSSSGSNSFIDSRNIAVDNLGNSYVVGNFKCTLDEFSAQYGAGTFNNVGFQDIFVAKYNSSGVWQWARQIGGRKDDFASGIILNASREPHIAGSFNEEIFLPKPSNFVGYGDMNASNGGSNLCGDGNYTSYIEFLSLGSSDILIAKVFDPARSPYDYYFRQGSGCSKPYLGVCIDGSLPCPDSLVFCGPSGVGVNPHIGQEGPDFNYLWSTGATTSSINVGTTGTYSVTQTSADLCYTSTDSVYVTIHNYPNIPPLTDDHGVNFHVISTSPVEVCAPDSVILTGDTVGCSVYSWIGPGLATYPHRTVTAVFSGWYIFKVTNAEGCSQSNGVYVNIFPAQSPIGLKMKVFNSTSDSCNVCSGSSVVILVYDTISNPSANANACVPSCNGIAWTAVSGATTLTAGTVNCPAPSIASFTFLTSGTYLITATVVRLSPCDTDTTVLSRPFYITVSSSPNVTITGTSLLCPGDSTVLHAHGANSHYTWTGTGISGALDRDSVVVINVGSISVIGFDSSGCQDNQNAYIGPKPNPQITINPVTGLICPGSFVTISVDLAGHYAWWGPFGLMSDTTQSIQVNLPGDYYCILTDNDHCHLVTATVEAHQYAVPVLTASPALVICPNDTVYLQVITNDGSTIQWQSPLSGSNPLQAITTPGTYTCHVTSCGILTVLHQVVTQGSPVAQITVSGPLNFCIGDSVTLTANNGMTYYEWSPTTLLTQSIVVHQSGTYHVTTGDGSGCLATSAPVTVNVFDLAAPVGSDTLICYNFPVTLNVVASPNARWFTTPSGGSPFTTGVSLTTAALTHDTVFYVETFNTYCTSPRVPIHVIIDTTSLPPPVFSNSPVCEGDLLHIYSTANSSLNFAWTGPNGFSNSSNDISIPSSALSDSGTYTLIVSGSVCSSSPSDIHVSVIDIPASPVITSNSPVCEGDTLFLSTPAGPGFSYSWSGPGGFSSSLQDPSLTPVSFSDAGNYFLRVTVGSCASPEDSALLVVIPTPAPPVISSNSPVCEGDSLLLNATAVAGAGYAWSGPGGYSSSGQNTFLSHISLLNNGSFTLEITVGGCTNSALLPVTVKPLPNPLDPVNNGPVCLEGNIQLTTASFVNATYSWHGPNGFTSTTQNPLLNQVTIADTGLFYVSATVDGCPGRAEATQVRLFESPSVKVGSDTALCNFETLLLDAGTGFTSYLWQDNSVNQVIVASVAGSYRVRVTDANGCEGSDSVFVTYHECEGKYKPTNIFSPNGDGENDLFGFDNKDYQFLNCRIFNRWGKLIYEFNHSGKKWDGTIQATGEPASDGVYYYIADFNTFSQSNMQLHGFVHLVRK